MNQFSSDWAARKHRREMDRLQGETAAGAALDNIADTGAALATIGTVVAPIAAPAFGIARATFIGLGLFGKAWRFGRPSVDQMIEDIETGADIRFREIEVKLEGQDSEQRKFEARLQSQEAETARLSALFHGLRSSDPEKHKRLGALTISCIFADDLKPESLDGMMRAAVELTEHDIDILGSIYKMEIHLFSPREMEKEYRWRLDAIRSLWEERWNSQPFSSYQGINGLAFNSSCARLQSAGLIASIGTKTILRGPTMHDYELLPEGKKFYERLQEVGSTK